MWEWQGETKQPVQVILLLHLTDCHDFFMGLCELQHWQQLLHATMSS
jgi:hypothetical protein